MSKASELFRRAASRYSSAFRAADINVVAADIEKLEQIEYSLEDISRRVTEERQRHEVAVASIENDRRSIQAMCNHHMVRPCAEAEQQCKWCGYVEPEYRRS